jgi:hypothetical protein
MSKIKGPVQVSLLSLLASQLLLSPHSPHSPIFMVVEKTKKYTRKKADYIADVFLEAVKRCAGGKDQGGNKHIKLCIISALPINLPAKPYF